MCRVPLDRLSEEKFARVLCYPKYHPKELERRLCEMRLLGIKALCFIGDKKIGNLSILGKGYVGVVVSACTEMGKAALKIRRTDADRETMKHEAEMLKIANSVSVGPKLIGFTQNLLLMEFIEGFLLPLWIERVKGERNAVKRIREVLRSILEQCRRLDEAGLDHGELSRAPRHIIVDNEDNPWILDFEAASNTRKVSNVTSICQFLFLKGKIADLISEATNYTVEDKIISFLRRYKRKRTQRNFNEILKACGLTA